MLKGWRVLGQEVGRVGGDGDRLESETVMVVETMVRKLVV